MNIPQYMKKQNNLSFLLKIFFCSIQTTQKKNQEINNLNLNFKKLKFKILYNTNKKLIRNSNDLTVNSREILTLLYLINFEENLQNNSLNRHFLNQLHLLSLNINKYTNNVVNYNPIFKNEYNHTFIIVLLYKLYKVRKFL